VEVIACEERTDREVVRPVRTGVAFVAVPPRVEPARVDAGADVLAAVVFRAAGAVFLAGAAFFAGAAFAAAFFAGAFFAGAFFAGAVLFAAFARLGAALPAARPAAAFFVAAARPADAFVAVARPAGPVLRRAAPPEGRSARRVRTSVFTSSGLRSAEIPETPRRRSCPRISSTFIREISDSEIPGVFGVWLPACRLVLVAVPPRPELFR
jgi:hypothetical protein